MVSHDMGRQSHYEYERDTCTKTARVNSLSKDLATPKKQQSSRRVDMSASSRNMCSGYSNSRKKHCPVHQPELGYSARSRSASSARYHSLEAYERLTGSLAFKPANRHRHEEKKQEVQSVKQTQTMKKVTTTVESSTNNSVE